jgi:hypothetical protein
MKQSVSLAGILILFSMTTMVVATPVTNVVTLKGVLDAANAIRANPSSYANTIQTQIRDKMDSDGLHTEWRLSFNEGTVAVDEAIEFLKSASPLPALVLNQGLTRSAWEHSKWQVEQNGG